MADKVSKWLTEEGLSFVKNLALEGLSITQIAESIGVGRRTITTWRERHEVFREAIDAGREVAVKNVEDALYKRALGYEYTETKTVQKANGDIEVTTTEKQMAPDVIAQIFYLKNRAPRDWKDRQEVELSGQVGLVQIIDDLDDAPEDDLLS